MKNRLERKELYANPSGLMSFDISSKPKPKLTKSKLTKPKPFGFGACLAAV